VGGQGQSHSSVGRMYLLTVLLAELVLAIDTGSSDLWIHTPNTLNITSHTDTVINLNYGIGSASGTVVYGPTHLGDFFVPQQGQIYTFIKV
jgi:hypothetical protein